ncbi:MAG: hypothetical protein V1740_04895 [Candidatus Woesearchaeota archaeon]
MKKTILLLLGLMIVIATTAYATDVAYVLSNPLSPNHDYIEVIDELNLTFDLIDSDNILTTDFSGYGFMLLNNEDFSNSGDIPVNEVKALLVNGRDMEEWGWTRRISKSHQNVPFHINLNQLDHTITQGFTQTDVQVYTSATPDIYHMNQYNKYSNIDVIASKVSDSEDIVIGTVRAGDILEKEGDTTYIHADSVFFGITDSHYWTAASRQLFKNSMAWLMDGDGDGYIGADDCDDTDPLVNIGMTEILYNGTDDDCNPLTLDDPAAPIFLTDPYTYPAIPSQGLEIKVLVEIEETLPDRIILHYTVNGGTEQSIDMTNVSSLWSANIGTFVEGDVVSYYIYANDTSGQESQTDVFEFIVTSEVVTIPVNMVLGANFISIPVLANSFEKDNLFSSAITSIVRYSAGAFPEVTTLANNIGYVAFSDSAVSETIQGITITEHQSVPINQGMNLVGVSGSSNKHLTDLPPEIIEVSKRESNGNFRVAVHYDSIGWFNSFELVPGVSYWMKATNATTWEYDP